MSRAQYAADWRKRNAEHVRRYRLEHREEHNAQNAEYLRAHAEEVRARKARQYRLHKHKIIHYDLKRNFRMTLEEYNQLLVSQDGRCRICRKEPADVRLGVDHDHACCAGKFACGECIRGLLCTQCNASLGVFHTPELLEAALKYLSHDWKQERAERRKNRGSR